MQTAQKGQNLTSFAAKMILLTTGMCCFFLNSRVGDHVDWEKSTGNLIGIVKPFTKPFPVDSKMKNFNGIISGYDAGRSLYQVIYPDNDDQEEMSKKDLLMLKPVDNVLLYCQRLGATIIQKNEDKTYNLKFLLSNVTILRVPRHQVVGYCCSSVGNNFPGNQRSNGYDSRDGGGSCYNNNSCNNNSGCSHYNTNDCNGNSNALTISLKGTGNQAYESAMLDLLASTSSFK